MRLSLGFSMRLQQRLDMRSGVPSWTDMGELSAGQMEELAREMVESAESDALTRSNAKNPGNLMGTRFFRERAHALSMSRPKEVAATIDDKLNIVSDSAEVRARIEELFTRLKRDEPAKPQNIFSQRFLRDFDYVTGTRNGLITHAVNHQRAFVQEPYEVMKLKELRQEDIAIALQCDVTTISRLMRNVMVTFPDTIERDVATLVPGHRLSYLQGRFALGMLARTPENFDSATKSWLVSDTELLRLLRTQYGIEIQPRTLRKYKLWMQENVLRTRRSKQDAYNDDRDDAVDDE